MPCERLEINRKRKTLRNLIQLINWPKCCETVNGKPFFGAIYKPYLLFQCISRLLFKS